MKPAQRLTLSAHKIAFRIPNRCSEKHFNSPLYKGAKNWNALDGNVQRLDTIDLFVKHVKQLYMEYISKLFQ